MKKVKILVCLLVCLTFLFSMSSAVFASDYSTGKAVIPTWCQNPDCLTYFHVANITDNPINITITLYDEDGTLVTDDNNISTGTIIADRALSNYSDQNIDSTVTFTLDSRSSTRIIIPLLATDDHYGYGVIQWNQDSHELQGIVVTGGFTIQYGTVDTRFDIPVNNGLPF